MGLGDKGVRSIGGGLRVEFLGLRWAKHSLPSNALPLRGEGEDLSIEV